MVGQKELLVDLSARDKTVFCQFQFALLTFTTVVLFTTVHYSCEDDHCTGPELHFRSQKLAIDTINTSKSIRFLF